MFQLSTAVEKLLPKSKAANKECSLHTVCSVCARVCKQSAVLNEPKFFSGAPQERIEIASDATQFPLRQSIRDASQWNEEFPYVFENEIKHHETAAQLEASAAQGCHLCSLLWHHLSLERYGILRTEFLMDEKRLAEESREKARETIRGCSAQLYVRFFIDDPERRTYYNQYAGIALYSGSHQNKLPQLRSVLCIWPTSSVESVITFKLTTGCFAKLAQSTSSERSISQAKTWIKQCQKEVNNGKNHMMCYVEPEDASWPTPTRLLDLSRSKKVRLYISPSPDEKSTLKYACLSHCWGGAAVMKLRKDNLNQFEREGIDISSLPATYRDAIDITRRLGIQYLWIDSLCIIQNSVEDWREEASKMAEIYSYAIVTVAALAAKNSTTDATLRTILSATGLASCRRARASA